MPVVDYIYTKLSKALVGLGVVVRTAANSTLSSDPTISAGSGAPSSNEPNGSLYLRTNGSVYKRTGGSWVAMTDPTSASAAAAATGISATTNNSGTGNTGSATTGISVAEALGSAELQVVDIELPALAGADVIAGAQSTDFDVTAWASITQPDVDRNVQVVFDASWNGGNIQVTGLDQSGSEITETINASAGSTVQGAKGFSLISRVKNTGTRSAGSCTVEYGPKLAVKVGGKSATLLAVYEWGTGKLTGKSLSSAGLLDLSTDAPDGAKSYTVSYGLSASFNVSDSGHTHTGPSHNHTVNVTDPEHTHTISLA